jgi:hypothetical protein
MGLFVVGRLAARHGVRVRLRHAQAGGLTALIWLPDTVAAPEVASPLGRLRRFEADDYGHTPSLSAPTVTAPSTAASQATAAARIPRFSPTAPAPGSAGPGGPAAPSFTPAANAGAPAVPTRGPAAPGGSAGPAGAQGPGAGADVPSQPGKPPVEGTPAGNNWEPAGNGWDLGNARADQDGPPTQALPVRNGSAAAPANGNAGSDQKVSRDQRDDAEPRTPGGPSRLPAFSGPPQAPQSPVGGQDVQGSDGPSAADAATVANGVASGGPGDPADGQVTVPPPGQVQRLPIFDSLESDWFRRSGHTLASPQPAQGGQAAQSAGQDAWTSPADEGWRAAQAVATPTAGETTQAGLPRRVPRANLVPGSVGSGAPGAPDGHPGPGSHDAAAEAPARSADVVRSRMASFQRGVREGRAAAPQSEEP